jgi:hypothetical protein
LIFFVLLENDTCAEAEARGPAKKEKKEMVKGVRRSVPQEENLL